MYRWLVWIHVAGAFAFLIAHGTSVAVAFRLRKERNRERLAALLELSSSTISVMWLSMLVLLAGGIAAGFVGHWWSAKWIWAALVLLILISIAMFPLATNYFSKIRAATGMRASGAPVASDEELEELVTSGRPWAIAAVGFGGLLIILWLMMFKPF